MTTFKAGRRNQRNTKGASQIAEFAPALYVLFILVLMPLLDLASAFVAGATQYLATQDFAAKAATQSDYPTSLNSMANEAYQFQGNGLAQFVHMSPSGGYTGCGDDLYVLSTDIASGAVTSSAADQTVAAPINTKTSMYELSVRSQYSVAPLVSLAAVPLLGQIPGLGKPMEFVFVANRPVEHPGGLQATPVNNSGGSVTPFARVASNPAVTAPPTNITWRQPGIFTLIKNAGQTVLSVNVLNVPSNLGPASHTGGWVSTGVVVSPGQTVWLDTQATGQWGNTACNYTWDANGTPGASNNPCSIDLDLTNQMLIGYVGNAPVLPYGFSSGGISGDPHFIPSGNTLLNFPLLYTGPISLACNDDQLSDTGVQTVRVIITQ